MELSSPTPIRPPSVCASAIHTIGYERRTLDEFIAILRRAPVDTLIDTRHRAGSRKRGFAKTALTEALREIGIRYEHRRELGTPPHLMEVMRTAGSYSLDAYEEHFDEHPQLLTDLQPLVAGARTVLLCYELDPAVCHRSVLARRVAHEVDLKVVHL